MKDLPLIFERSRPGRTAWALPKTGLEEKPASDFIPSDRLRKSPPSLPELAEPDLVRHYTLLSQRNFSIDTGFYPLGSCTMKYNPRINEKTASLPAFTGSHPLQPDEAVQGILELMYRLEGYLAEISGLDAVTLQPAAGAHGELVGLMLIKAWHAHRGEDHRDEVIIPDSAHGTNPATCSMCRYKAIPLPSAPDGSVDLEELDRKCNERTAGMMITVPSTLGLFEPSIRKIADRLHRSGAQLYMDGANMNALLGHARPGDFGVDVMHFNLHKTFSTPHGGGGPGAGPVACRAHLAPFLPVPRIVQTKSGFRTETDRPDTIGRIKSHFGNVGVLIRAYTYIRQLGHEGLRRVSENAVLNANYLKARMPKAYTLPYGDQTCMHEFVATGTRFKKFGIRTLDIAKRLLDLGFHPPTIYFPLIVPECLMIEPTETETKETLDAFADALKQIAQETRKEPELVSQAPHTLPVRRINEVKASREPVLRYKGLSR